MTLLDFIFGIIEFVFLVHVVSFTLFMWKTLDYPLPVFRHTITHYHRNHRQCRVIYVGEEVYYSFNQEELWARAILGGLLMFLFIIFSFKAIDFAIWLEKTFPIEVPEDPCGGHCSRLAPSH